jgi:hypothetical protein
LSSFFIFHLLGVANQNNFFFCLHVIEVMDDPRFNDIFNGDFDDNYDNVMNRIIDHINYPSCKGSGASIAGAGDDGDGNVPTTVMMMTVTMAMTMTVMITMNLF